MVTVRNLTRGTILGESVDVADTSAKRRTGLLKHDRLEPGHGLWIKPCESVHTFFMKFAIDLIYLDKKHIVRKAKSAVPPLAAFGLPERVFHSGTSRRHHRAGPQTRRGDQLTLEPQP